MPSSAVASRRGRIAVIAVAVLFSTGGAAIKLASMSAWQIAGLRSLVAFAVLFVLVRPVRRVPSVAALALAVPYAGVMVLFVHANTFASAGAVTLLQATAPLYVIVLSPWLLKERPRLRSLLVLPLFLTGMLILLSEQEASSALATAPILGRWLAAGAGLCFGLVILGLSVTQRSGAPSEVGKTSSTAFQAIALGNLLASLISLPPALQHWQPLGLIDVSVAVYLGAIQIGLAYAILLPAMRALRAAEVSLLLLLELVFSPLFAALVHQEEIGIRTVFGGVVIMGACAFDALDAGPHDERAVE